MSWTVTETNDALVDDLSATLNVSKVTGRLLVQRGLTSAQSANAYLRPNLANLEDPFRIKNLRKAVDRIEQAIGAQESIIVFGDYDVDGITSTVQLVSILRKFGLNPQFCVPLRLDEGYGLSREAIDRAFDSSVPDLFIAVDCGTNSHEEIAYLRDLGCDVIIVDHHQSLTTAPKDCIFINPHVNDAENVSWGDLCTAGLVFKLLHGLLKSLRMAGDGLAARLRLKDYLDLVAMGTVADMVPLQGENRILSWYGLRHLHANGRSGIVALAKVSSIEAGQKMTSSDISFKLAPRINASGRLADASLPITLLLSEDLSTSRRIAKELDDINCERQSIQQSIITEAEQRAEAEFADAPGIVLFSEGWHSGVVGIVASRISRRFHKPCVILGAESGRIAKGSGRSIATVNLVKIFELCHDLLESWGGHPMAAGISLQASSVAAFTQRYLEVLQTLYPQGVDKPSLKLASWLSPEDLNEQLLAELDLLSPFGQGNQEPVFGLKNVVLDQTPQSFGQNQSHFRFHLQCSETSVVAGVAWSMQHIPEAGQPIDLAFRFARNYWRGRCNPQMTLIDWRPAVFAN